VKGFLDEQAFFIFYWNSFPLVLAQEPTSLPSFFPEVAGEPPKRLIGWARVELAPGESKQVSIPVAHDHLTIYDEASDEWKLVPGNCTVMAGGSSQDLPLYQQINLSAH
jgi:beta-glucosidase